MNTYDDSILIKNIIRSERMVTGNKNLYNFLVEKYIDLKSVFCLSMIPELGEDIYTLMINKNKVIMVDVSRLDSSAVDEFLSAEYTYLERKLLILEVDRLDVFLLLLS